MLSGRQGELLHQRRRVGWPGRGFLPVGGLVEGLKWDRRIHRNLWTLYR